MACVDNAAWRDAGGFGCTAYAAGCALYPQFGQWLNCPVTCGACPPIPQAPPITPPSPPHLEPRWPPVPPSTLCSDDETWYDGGGFSCVTGYSLGCGLYADFGQWANCPVTCGTCPSPPITPPSPPHLEPRPPPVPPSTPPCADDETWRDGGGFSCVSGYSLGCGLYADFGQWDNCPKTCGTCFTSSPPITPPSPPLLPSPSPSPPPMRPPAAPCRDDVGWRDNGGFGCVAYIRGCNTYPDFGQYIGCPLTCGTCTTTIPSPPQSPPRPPCSDDPAWRDRGGFGCTAYASGCWRFGDFGQWDNCVATCNMCTTSLPPRPPSPEAPPVAPPLPGYPPIAPGLIAVESATELRDIISTGNDVRILLRSHTRLAFGGVQCMITSNVTLESDGTGVLDAQDASRLFNIVHGRLKLSGLHLVHGLCVGTNTKGGMIRVEEGALVANDCVFSDSSIIGRSGSPQGGAIFVTGMSVCDLRRCQFTRCSVTSNVMNAGANSGLAYGGAIFFKQGTLSIAECSFAFCNAFGNTFDAYTSGAGIFVEAAASVVMVGTTFTDCYSQGKFWVYGAADITAETSLLNGTKFVRCQAGGGMSLNAYGGGVCLSDGDHVLIDCEFDACRAISSSDFVWGAAIFMQRSSVELLRCSILRCEASSGGVASYAGAVYMASGVLTLTGGLVQDCISSSGTDYVAFSGAIYIETGMLTVAQSTFRRCRALAANLAYLSYGGAICVQKGTVTLFESAFEECTSESTTYIANGGAIELQGGSLAATDCNFVGCTSTSFGTQAFGGVISSSGTLKLISSAVRGGEVLVLRAGANLESLQPSGGAVAIITGRAVVRDCVFEGASAATAPNVRYTSSDDSRGGAFYLGAGARLSIVGSTSFDNCTARRGALFYVSADAFLSITTMVAKASCEHRSSLTGLLIESMLGAVTVIRGSRISLENCDGFNSSDLISVPSGLAGCTERTFTNIDGRAKDVCGIAAICTQVPLFGGDQAAPESVVLHPQCECGPGDYPDVQLGSSPDAAPFIHGCLSPRGPKAISYRTRDIVHVGLFKDPTRSSSPFLNTSLTLTLEGTDPAPGQWLLHVTYETAEEEGWLHPQLQGSIPAASTPQDVLLPLSIVASGLRERAEPYRASLYILATAMLQANYTVEVKLSVTAGTTDVVWGQLDGNTTCNDARGSATEALLDFGVVTPITFQACDLDGLPVAHALPIATDERFFQGLLLRGDLQLLEKNVAVDPVGAGLYDALVEPPGLGQYDVALQLRSPDASFQANHVFLKHTKRIIVSCPAGPRVPMPDGLGCGCPMGMVWEGHGLAGQCVPCALYTSSSVGATSCDVCAAGRYRFNATTTASTTNCRECPIGSVGCDWNSTLQSWRLAGGWWRVSGFTTELHECKKSSDSNGSSPCAGGSEGGALGSGYCAQGFGGPLCAVCVEDGFHYDDGRCETCPQLESVLAPALTCTFVLFLLAFAAVVLGKQTKLTETLSKRLSNASSAISRVSRQVSRQVSHASWDVIDQGLRLVRQPSSASFAVSARASATDLDNILRRKKARRRSCAAALLGQCYQRASSLSRAGIQYLRNAAFLPKLKIAIAFFQIMLSIPSVYAIEVPDSWHRWLSVFDWVNVDFFSVYPAPCMSSVSARLNFTALGSFAIVCTMLALGGLHVLAMHFIVAGESAGGAAGLVRRMMLNGLPWALFAVFIFVPSVSRIVFRGWSCQRYRENDYVGTSVEFLLMQKSLQCGTDEHRAVKNLAVVYIVVWSLIIPMACFILVASCRSDIRAGRSTSLSKATRILHNEYHTALWYWEAISLGHRLFVTGYASLIPNNFGIIRLTVTVLVSILFLSVLMIAQPYKRHDVNLLAITSNLILTVAFLASLLIKLHDDFIFYWNAEGTARVLGFSSTTDLAVLLIVFSFSFVGAVILAFIHRTKSVDELVQERLTAILTEFNLVQDAYDELTPQAQLPTRGRVRIGPFAGKEGSARSSAGRVSGLSRSSSSSDEPASLDADQPKHQKQPGDALRGVMRMSFGTGDEALKRARLAQASARIRDPQYGLKEFFQDMVYCFPELDLYLDGWDEVASSVRFNPDRPEESRINCHMAIVKGEVLPTAGSAGENGNRSSSGLTSVDEYKRTVGALFGCYWLMRLSLPQVPCSDALDGQLGFCFGVDAESWRPLHGPQDDSAGARKREQFLRDQDWGGMHKLMVDSQMLDEQPDGSVQVNAERTAAMLALTAIHDVMKLSALLPKVLPEHAPYQGVGAKETINDHDVALAYVLEHDPTSLPCYHHLCQEQQAAVLFTQAKLGFNHGWLVQAEAPPAALFNTFKELIEQGSVDSSMIAFYFVHWLTDLGGALPSPLMGAEKFVVGFPLSVLKTFIQSFPLVQRLATLSQTALFEECLIEWWPREFGPPPTGSAAVAKMRLVVQAQSDTVKSEVLAAFDLLSPASRHILATEMARTGIDGQSYRASPAVGGPAFLVYYSPAFLRQSLEGVPLALLVLAEVYHAARMLYPLSPDPLEAGRCVTIRIDELKACGDARSVVSKGNEGQTWVLKRSNNKEALVACVDEIGLRSLAASQETTAFHILPFHLLTQLLATQGAEGAPESVQRTASTSRFPFRRLSWGSTPAAPTTAPTTVSNTGTTVVVPGKHV